jgi:hypothetical protein
MAKQIFVKLFVLFIASTLWVILPQIIGMFSILHSLTQPKSEFNQNDKKTLQKIIFTC